MGTMESQPQQASTLSKMPGDNGDTALGKPGSRGLKWYCWLFLGSLFAFIPDREDRGRPKKQFHGNLGRGANRVTYGNTGDSKNGASWNHSPPHSYPAWVTKSYTRGIPWACYRQLHQRVSASPRNYVLACSVS